MTAPQQQMLIHSRNLMQGVVAKAQHLLTPESPWFSPEQRQAIINTMNSLEQAQGQAHPEQQPRSAAGGAANKGGGTKAGPKAGDIEDGYRFKGGNKADKNNWEKVQ
jgi:hypothetical protein